VRASDRGHSGVWATFQILDAEVVEGLSLFVDPPGDEKPLRGRVVDPDGEPIPDASIIGRGARCETDDKGEFYIHLDPGPNTLKVEADGYITRECTIYADSPRTVKYVLEPIQDW
jgi:hypothetical protein